MHFRFFRKTASFVPLFLLAAALSGQTPERRKLVDDGFRCGQTIIAMRTIRMAVEAYEADHRAYPSAASIDELRALLEPVYIGALPLKDAWGTPFRYARTADGRGYRLVSAGSDRAFDESSWNVPGLRSSSKDDAVLMRFEDDADREWTIQK